MTKPYLVAHSPVSEVTSSTCRPARRHYAAVIKSSSLRDFREVSPDRAPNSEPFRSPSNMSAGLAASSSVRVCGLAVWAVSREWLPSTNVARTLAVPDPCGQVLGAEESDTAPLAETAGSGLASRSGSRVTHYFCASFGWTRGRALQ